MPTLASLLDAPAGARTVVSGVGKDAGKTSLVGLALPVVRAGGPAGVFSVGLDGERRGRHAARIDLAPGDVSVTTQALARASTARFEILEALPGRSAMGRLLLVRAIRGGSVAVVGPDTLSALEGAIRTAEDAAGVRRVLIDSPAGRLTQVAALSADFLAVARVDPGTLAATASRLAALEALADLPPAGPADHSGGPHVDLDGPLTPAVLDALPSTLASLTLADLTACFLAPAALARLLRRVEVSVRRRLDLRGIVVSLRDVTRESFAAALGRPPGQRYLFDPWLLPSPAGGPAGTAVAR